MKKKKKSQNFKTVLKVYKILKKLESKVSILD